MDRPIYFAVSGSPEAYLGLEKYLQLEGLTYRVVPKLNTSGPYNIPARLDQMYDNMMNKLRFGGIKENPNVYLDENILRMTLNLRANYGRLGETLLAKAAQEESMGNADAAKSYREKAAKAIDLSLDQLPATRVPHSVFDYTYPEIYYQAGQKEKGHKLLLEMMDKAKDELNYYKIVYKYTMDQARESGDMNYVAQLQQGAFVERREVREQLYIMQEMDMTAKKFDDPAFAEKVDKDFKDYQMSFVQMTPEQKQQLKNAPVQ